LLALNEARAGHVQRGAVAREAERAQWTRDARGQVGYVATLEVRRIGERLGARAPGA
jgi:hypothetical protein